MQHWINTSPGKTIFIAFTFNKQQVFSLRTTTAVEQMRFILFDLVVSSNTSISVNIC